MRKGNVFTGGVWHTPPWADPPPGQTPTQADTPHPGTATEAGSLHPTGMHSCFNVMCKHHHLTSLNLFLNCAKKKVTLTVSVN